MSRVVPNIASDKLDDSRDSYAGLLGFQVAMDLGWILTLVSPSNPTAQLSVVRQDATAPVIPQLTVEVADVEAIHAQAVRRGLELEYPLTDEPWGVRRFFVKDPNGWCSTWPATVAALPRPDGGGHAFPARRSNAQGSQAASQGCLVPARSSSIVLSTRR
jgi:catechol 2,3-dioxygenase-like lactoylglutathione lyase family enzyme